MITTLVLTGSMLCLGPTVGPRSPVDAAVASDGTTDESGPPAPAGESDPAPPQEGEPEASGDAEREPALDALEHLARAQALEAAGDLPSAEAEASIAIALDPQDPAAYLERGQIRITMADEAGETDESARRARAGLLRLAADDLGAYLEHGAFPTDSQVWFQTRRDALLRSADALDPPKAEAEPKAGPEPKPAPKPKVIFTPRADDAQRDRDVDPRWKTGSLLGTGVAAGAAAVVLSAMSLQIERSCPQLCGVRWGPRPGMIATAGVMATLGTTTLAIGVASAPAMSRKRVRVATGATTAALGTLAVVLGSVTAGIASARWRAPLSPSDDAGLRATQALANTSTASFTFALPMLGASLAAWLSPKRHSSGVAVAASRFFARRR